MSEELRLRIRSGIVMATVVLAATWIGGIAFRLLAASLALIVFYEWSSVTRLRQTRRIGFVLGWTGMVLIAAAVVLDFLSFASALLLAFTLLALADSALKKGSGWLPGGILYAGLTCISLAAIRGADVTGLKAMLVIFSVVWSTDVLAYFVGRRVGGPKLAPRISPGKTWSGAIGGTVSGVVFGLVTISLADGAVTVGAALLLLVLSIFSQMGDLFESFVKRRFGVKDSSRLIPGHGGVMDRVDGLVFACFAAYLMAATVNTLSSCTQCSVGSFLLGIDTF